MKTIRTFILGVLTSTLCLSAFAQGTAFTYQGRLDYAGGPANGAFDLVFSVWSSPVGPAQIGSTLTNLNVSVNNGLATVQLDFGPGVFTGADRWLEIGIRTNGGSAFLIGAPRQQITPAPYAMNITGSGALGDGVLSSNVALLNRSSQSFTGGTNIFNGRVGIGSSDPHHSLRLSGSPLWTTASWGGALELDNASAIGWRANAIGNRFGIGQSTGGLYVFATTSDPGNTDSSANYLMTFDDFGRVGIGTPTPGNRLTVRTLTATYGIEHTDGSVRLATYVGGSTGGGWLGTISNHKLSFFVNNGSASMTIDNTGSVGIGTISPASALQVIGTVTATAFNPTSDRNAKENFAPVNPLEVLDKVAAMPISRWNFKGDLATPHLGPMAQDFHAAFSVGTDDQHIATVDADGVALAAIQGLNEKVEVKSEKSEVRFRKLEAENAELKQRLASLEKILSHLEANH